MRKTRVAHGYCSRHLAQDACPYANICEQCDNFVPAPEFVPALQDQFADVEALRATRNSAAGPTRVNAINASLSTYTGTSASAPNRLVLPTEHSCSRPNGRLIERPFGETRRRVKVVGRLPGERSCLSLVWAVLDRATAGWRGVRVAPADARLLARLRARLEPANCPPQPTTSPLSPAAASRSPPPDPHLNHG